jgi:hypothetical protein
MFKGDKSFIPKNISASQFMIVSLTLERRWDCLYRIWPCHNVSIYITENEYNIIITRSFTIVGVYKSPELLRTYFCCFPFLGKGTKIL